MLLRKKIWKNLIFSCVFSGPAFSVQKMNLQDAIQVALTQSYLIQASQISLLNANLGLQNAKGQYFPNLNFSSSHGYQKSLLEKENEWPSSFDFTLSENIYDNGQRENNHSVQEKNLLKEEEIKKNVQLELLKDIKEIYHAMSLKWHLVKMNHDQIQQVEKQLNLAKSFYLNGQKKRGDYLKLKTDLQRLHIEDQNLKNELEITGKKLQLLIGMDPTKDVIEWEVIQDQPIVSDLKLESLDIEKHPLMLSQVLDQDLQLLQLNKARKDLWPNVNLITGLNYGSHSYIKTDQTISANDDLRWNIGLKVDYTIYDHGIKNREVEKVMNANRGEEIKRTQKLNEFKLRRDQFFSQLYIIKNQWQLHQELLSNEKETLTRSQEEFRRGALSYLDLANATKNFFSTRSAYLSTYFRYLDLMAEYDYLRGQLL